MTSSCPICAGSGWMEAKISDSRDIVVLRQRCAGCDGLGTLVEYARKIHQWEELERYIEW